jgi:hypothetical protein
MIIYELACTHGHRFEGWFASAEDFARQRERSLVACPMCDDARVERVPSARVAISKDAPDAPRASAATTAPAMPETPATAEPAIAGLPPELIGKLREIVKQTENVGRRFPEEARKIHYEEAPARAIRGQASAEEAKALNDEGIEFAAVPPFLIPDQH